MVFLLTKKAIIHQLSLVSQTIEKNAESIFQMQRPITDEASQVQINYQRGIQGPIIAQQ